MNRIIAFLATIALCVTCSTVFALYSVSNRGDWPKSWPKELEPLRKQSRTLVGPMDDQRHYAIPFAKREEMESAWPQILKVKSKGTAVRLLRGANFFLGENRKAGVVVHCPPLGQEGTKSIDLIIDGDVVDLNRIPLPADTPIIDERFKD